MVVEPRNGGSQFFWNFFVELQNYMVSELESYIPSIPPWKPDYLVSFFFTFYPELLDCLI